MRLARSTERVLGGLQFWKNTASLIERADLPLRTGEVFYIQLGCALLFGMPAGFAGVFPLIVLGLCFILIPLYGRAGAAIATAAALIIESIMLFVVTKRRLGFHVFVWNRAR